MKGVSALAVVCGLLGGPAAAFAHSSDHAVASVTVTGHRPASRAAEIERIAQADGAGFLARWDSPVCPVVDGLPNAFDDFILRRIRDIAGQVGAPVAPRDCRPNVLIFVTPNPTAFTQKLVKLKEQALAGGRWPVDKTRLEEFANESSVARWFYMSTMVQASSGGHIVSDPTASPHASGIVNGGACACGLEAFLGTGAGPSAPQFGNVIPSRLTPAGEEVFTQAIIVVDADRVAGLEAGQMADYLGMLTLAHVKPVSRFAGTDTILNLFADGTDAARRPKGLRPWDTAYLTGLYGADAQKTRASQVTHVGSRMTFQLKDQAFSP